MSLEKFIQNIANIEKKLKELDLLENKEDSEKTNTKEQKR